jgi:hypothetical protein
MKWLIAKLKEAFIESKILAEKLADKIFGI